MMGEPLPLKIPDVLENIFKFCTVPDLKMCRLVATDWYEISLKSWRIKASCVRIAWVDQVVKFLKYLEDCKASNYRTHHTFEIFKLSFITITESDAFSSFWSTCGNNIRILNADGCKFPNLTVFEDVILKHCPNLEQLRLRAVGIERWLGTGTGISLRYGENENLKSLLFDDTFPKGIPLTEFFQRFPSLHSLEYTAGMVTWNAVEAIFETIKTIRLQDSRKLPLKRIRIDFGGNDYTLGNWEDCNQLQVLTDPLLKIEDLLVPLTGNNSDHALQEILRVHGCFLRNVELSRGGDNFLIPEQCFFTSGSLENLEQIVLHSGQVFTSLAFLEFTPNLKSLSISNASGMIAGTNFSDIQNIRLEKCCELEVDGLMTVEDIQKLVVCFPNVELLKIELDNETFAFVCQHWPNLVKLQIVCSRVDECGFTGLNSEHVDMINEEFEGNHCGRLPTVPRAPNISSLKCLRYLSIRRWHSLTGPYSNFRYCAIAHGILEMPSLEKLDICSCLLPKDSLEILSEMVELKIHGKSASVKVKSNYGSHEVYFVQHYE